MNCFILPCVKGIIHLTQDREAALNTEKQAAAAAFI